MEIGIVGLPRSGKTTIFNAATRGRAAVAAFAGDHAKPNFGVAKVPDERLDRLVEMFKPKRTVPAEITYVDVPGAPEGFGKTRGISGRYLNNLQTVDALLIVARAFEDPSVTHVDDTVDLFRDVEAMLLELTISDLELLERRAERIADSFKGARAVERERLEKEQAIVTRLRAQLDAGVPIRDQTLADDEAQFLEGSQMLTAKPVIVVANVGEDQIEATDDIEKRLKEVAAGTAVETGVICGRLEMELGQMEPDDEKEFRDSLGAGESGLGRMVHLSYQAGTLITFFTTDVKEVRAWPAQRGATAARVAGKIHSDFEKGFVRAEVVGFDDFLDCGSIAEARRRGTLRHEGRDYVVQDGDLITILFNV